MSQVIYYHHADLAGAFNVIPADKEFVIVRHTLAAGEEIKPHHHPRANEWLIADGAINGTKDKMSFIVTVGEDVQKFKLSAGDAFLINLPMGERHSLKAITNITYFVIRDKKDKTVYAQ